MKPHTLIGIIPCFPPYLTDLSYMTGFADSFPLTTPAHFPFSFMTSSACIHHAGRASLARSLRFSLLETII
jgi:hypothetical protein